MDAMLDLAVPPQVAADLAAIGRFAAVARAGCCDQWKFLVPHRRRARRRDALGDRQGEYPLGGPGGRATRWWELPAGVSAETPLHVARYRRDSGVGAIVHVHTVAATVLSRADAAQEFVELEGFEMHKSLRGVTTHEGTLRLPIFANDQDTSRLAGHIEATLPAQAPVPGYLLAGHGLYAWGATTADAQRHLEGLEFLLQCSLEERRLHR